MTESTHDIEAGWAKAIAEAGVATEQEMREAEVPWLKTEDELVAYIRALVDRPHDYGTCVYAMSMAATAAFRYVASSLGATGFQASCADMDILRRTRHLKAGFRILNYENLLYPQYWNRRDFPSAEYLAGDPDVARRLAELARERLENVSEHTSGRVVEHWRKLAEAAP